MQELVSIKELSSRVGLKEAKIRRWTKKGIFTPIQKSEEDGKSFLYNIDCVEFKLEILEKIRIDFSDLNEIGKRFKKVFGRRNSDLLEAMQTTVNKKKLLKKYEEEILDLHNDSN